MEFVQYQIKNTTSTPPGQQRFAFTFTARFSSGFSEGGINLRLQHTHLVFHFRPLLL